MAQILNIIPIHFEQNLAHSKSIDVALIVRAGEICFGQNLAHSKSVDVALIVRAGEICFGQNLAHSKSVDVALIVRAGEICFGQNLAHSKNEVKRICRRRGSNPGPFEYETNMLTITPPSHHVKMSSNF